MNRLIMTASIALLLVIANIEEANAESIVRLGEIKRGNVLDYSVASLKTDNSGGLVTLGNQFVIAMRDADDKLRLMVIEVSDAGHPNVVANIATEGTIKSVSVTRVSTNRIVTAVRDNEDKLRLIAFEINNNGRTIDRLGTKVSKTIREVDIAGDFDAASAITDNKRVFTAASDADGKLFVADWKVKQNGNIKLLGSETYPSASLLGVESGLVGPNFMSVTMRDSKDSLRLIAFQSPQQIGIKRGGFGAGGKIQEVSSTGYSFNSDLYTLSISEGPVGVTAGATPIDRYFIYGAGVLKIIRWAHMGNDASSGLIDISSNNLERKSVRELTGAGRSDAMYEGMAETADIMNLDSFGSDAKLITAHAGFGTFNKLRSRDQGKPRLRIITWNENLSAMSKAHLGGQYTHVELIPMTSVNDTARFVTVLRGIRGELKVVVWGIN